MWFFFRSFGFAEINGTPVSPAVYEQLLRSYDEGVAEFLDLERVKPNTLGNTRMLLHLSGAASGDMGAAGAALGQTGGAGAAAGSDPGGNHRVG